MPLTHEEKMELIAAGQVLATLAVAYSDMSRNDTRDRIYEQRSRMAAEKAVACLYETKVYSVEALRQ